MKSLITALWERSVSKQKVDPINPDPDSGMTFEFLGQRVREGGGFRLTSNTSLEYIGSGEGDFSVYLAGNWRFELSVDCSSGRCARLTGFMSKLTAKQADLNIPAAEPKVMYCRSDRLMSENFGCYSAYPVNSVYFDPKKLVMCIGDPEAEGEAGEFLDDAVAVINAGRLVCIYLRLDRADEAAVSGEDNLMNCIVLV